MCLSSSVNLRDPNSCKSIEVYKVMEVTELDGELGYTTVFYGKSKRYRFGDTITRDRNDNLEDFGNNVYPSGIHCFLSPEDAIIYRKILALNTVEGTKFIIVACRVLIQNISSFGITKVWDDENYLKAEIGSHFVNLTTIVADKVQLVSPCEYAHHC